jgi:hypothetical protein
MKEAKIGGTSSMCGEKEKTCILVRKHQYERMFDDQVGWEDNSNTDSREIQ